MKVDILRLDHRTHRDQRITSHLALTARTLGAKKFIYSGEKDENMEKSIQDVVQRWGGNFTVCYSTQIRSEIKNFNGIKVHLTMYGEDHTETTETLKLLDENILIILGGSKVPRFVYDLADFNTAIGSQPHSEVAALAIFLYCIYGDTVMYSDYEDALNRIQKGNLKSQRSERFTHH